MRGCSFADHVQERRIRCCENMVHNIWTPPARSILTNVLVHRLKYPPDVTILIPVPIGLHYVLVVIRGGAQEVCACMSMSVRLCVKFVCVRARMCVCVSRLSSMTPFTVKTGAQW